jgi:hypothetical protein
MKLADIEGNGREAQPGLVGKCRFLPSSTTALPAVIGAPAVAATTWVSRGWRVGWKSKLCDSAGSGGTINLHGDGKTTLYGNFS